MRRLTILTTIVIVSLSLAVGIYVLASIKSSIDSQIGDPISYSIYSALLQDSFQPYGSPAPASMTNLVQDQSGSPLSAGGKPVVVYIGADFCPYCAIERWPLIVALTRFGTFSNLHYMASSVSEGDYATFTFVGSRYQSDYLVFQSFENEDRNSQPLQPVPANYSSPWEQKGSRYPFMNFANRYVIVGPTMLPDALSGKNWTQIATEINRGDNLGTQVKESANLLTSLICKLTDNAPASVCNASPIAATTIGIAAPTPTVMGMIAIPSRQAGFSPGS